MAPKMREAAFLALASVVGAQNLTQSIAPSATVNGTPIANPTLLATTFPLNVEDMWDLLVGPVTSAYYTTVVSPTPVPSSSLIPPPPLHYSPFPAGQQVPMEGRNESWAFPKTFLWGVAGAAYQVEGGAKSGSRGPSVWDVLTHRVTNYVQYNYTADITTNSYYMYKEDISRLAAMGVRAYSLSLSWSRIMPFGRGPVNEEAIAYYNDVINTCIDHGIVPFVTLYHWDTPLALQNSYGGWLSEDIVEDFVAYARVAYGEFGDRVKYWFTVNEPIVFCNQYPLPAHYFKNFTIPNQHQPWYCGQNVLLAHAQAYHLGKSMIADSIITYKNNGGYKIPLTNSTEDSIAVQRAWDFNEGWFSTPIFLTGDYPSSVKAYTSTFLRPFNSQEIQSIKNTSDAYAHDAYTSQFYLAPDSGIDACVSNSSHPLYPSCANTTYTYSAADGGWAIGTYSDPLSSWLHHATDWLPAFLRYIADTWAGDKPIIVSEFGFAEPFEAQKTILPDILSDAIRASYFKDYTTAMLVALSEGTNLIGCVAWSFVDNFEWGVGFASKFGLQYVNFSDPKLPRYYKKSFFEYKHAFDVYQET